MSNIQFSGLPGVGKTTFVHALVDKYPEKYCLPELKVINKKGLIKNWPYLMKVVFNPKYSAFTVLAFFSIILSGMKIGFSIKAISGVIINLVNYELNQSRESNKTMLWDEMLSQRCFSCLGYAKSFNKLSRVLFLLMNALSCRICNSFLLVTDENFSKRLFKRGLTERMKNLKETELKNVIDTHEVLNEYAILKSGKIIYIDLFDYDDSSNLEGNW